MRYSTRTLAVLAVASGLAVLTGCGTGGSGAGGTSWKQAGEAGPNAVVAIAAPADGAADVPTATEVKIGTPDPAAKVTFADATGTAVEGTLSADGATWTPDAQLKYGTTYTATVSEPNRTDAKVTFTTMAKPSKLANVSVNMADDATYGVAMPVVVTFGVEVPKDARAAIEKRLKVTSEPAQEGAWSWFSETEVHYRPKEYWAENTKLSVKLGTGGVAIGKWYGQKDVTVKASIGERLEIKTDNATHTMSVVKQGTVIKTVPVSLGKDSTPSSSGAMVIMDKNKSEVFRGDASDPYVETVYYVQRLTTGGEYIHAAPWSEDDQGKRNVSHGCTNVSQKNAIWLYDLTKVGDPVTVSGTPRKLERGNGWTDWDMSWDEFKAGSALN